jgi:hypothetical protein
MKPSAARRKQPNALPAVLARYCDRLDELTALLKRPSQ